MLFQQSVCLDILETLNLLIGFHENKLSQEQFPGDFFDKAESETVIRHCHALIKDISDIRRAAIPIRGANS